MGTLPDEVHDFQSLVLWLLKTHHNGNQYQMAKHLEVGATLISLWCRGRVKRPRMRYRKRLAQTYNLNLQEVNAVIEQHKPRSLPPEVTNLASLIKWLAKEYHHGKYAPMVSRLDVSPALVYQWKDGVTRSFGGSILRRACHSYNLDESEVMKILG